MSNKIIPSHTAPIDDAISNLTDWVELKTIFSNFNAFNLSDLSSLTEEAEDEENINFTAPFISHCTLATGTRYEMSL